MPRTLKAITGEWLRCQRCAKPLRPDTSTVELSGQLEGVQPHPCRGNATFLGFFFPDLS
jgi:hypothetical protein